MGAHSWDDEHTGNVLHEIEVDYNNIDIAKPEGTFYMHTAPISNTYFIPFCSTS